MSNPTRAEIANVLAIVFELDDTDYATFIEHVAKGEFGNAIDLVNTQARLDDKSMDEACPGCGCKPGDGITASCNHPEGCGWSKAQIAPTIVDSDGNDVSVETPEERADWDNLVKDKGGS